MATTVQAQVDGAASDQYLTCRQAGRQELPRTVCNNLLFSCTMGPHHSAINLFSAAVYTLLRASKC